MLHDSCPKISKIPKFFIIFSQKINKIPEVYMIFARKMPEFYIIARKNFFSRILGGNVPPCSPVSYAYGQWFSLSAAVVYNEF